VEARFETLAEGTFGDSGSIVRSRQGSRDVPGFCAHLGRDC